MLTIVTNENEVRDCQKALEERSQKNIEFRYSTRKVGKSRYYNGFGVSADPKKKKSNLMFVEANIPLSGVDRSVSGIFAKASNTNKIYLLHRGILQGISREAFLDWRNEDLETLNDDLNEEHEAIMIGEIASSSFITDLEKFVLQVLDFKSLVKSGEIDEATYLTDEKLLEKAKARLDNKDKIRDRNTKVRARDPFVAEYAKRRADGKCQLCCETAPFKDKLGRPYLEVHHITWLSEDGDDSIENTVALCPNCHREMHILDLKSDIEKLKRSINES